MRPAAGFEDRGAHRDPTTPKRASIPHRDHPCKGKLALAEFLGMDPGSHRRGRPTESLSCYNPRAFRQELRGRSQPGPVAMLVPAIGGESELHTG